MRHPNYRLVKIHRNYSVEEVARLLGIHRNTVREWIKRGLPTCDQKRPTLVLGRHLSEFLRSRRLKNRRRCSLGELYCVRCRDGRRPAGGLADYIAKSDTLGNLMGICPLCDTLMYRRVNPSMLEQIRGVLEVSQPEGKRDIDESPRPSVNSDFRGETRT